jgi:hypothetical protein
LVAAAIVGQGLYAILHNPSHASDRAVTIPLAVVSLIGSLLVVRGYQRLLSKRRTEFELYQVARSLARLVCKDAGVDSDYVGVHVWRRAGIGKAQHLIRVAAFSPERKVAPAITWRKDRGVVGLCWRTEKEQLISFNDEAEAELGRGGMTEAEIDRTRLFRLIWATPLLSPSRCSGRFIGCMSLDISEDGHLDAVRALVDRANPALEALLASGQALLDNYGDVGSESIELP